MAEYRLLEPREWPLAVDLWTRVFPVDAPFFTSLLEGGGPDDNVSLAALEDGRIVSSVHVFMRSIRDREGRPMKVGGIGSVSTDPEHRKRGHSGRLLETALAEMERAGCVWSLLGTGVNDHYARHGWRTVSTPDPWGELLPLGNEPPPPEGRGELLAPDGATLEAMAALYDAETATRPMATVRSERAWRTAVRYRLSGRTFILGVHEGGRLVAYVVARKPGGAWTFTEAVGEPSYFPELFAAMAVRLRVKVEDHVRASLPQGAAMDAFASITERVVPGESRGTMLRPIANRISWPDLLALYGDPKGRSSDLDAF